MKEEVTLGEAIRTARTARQRKMMAVHRFVSASTINAIEHDRMCPSVSILDAISHGLELPTGVWDERQK
ncbi:MAG: helix-turn-helix transcriptional regulator [Thermaerobacter sp.]|nr:helix-turn-helix transcriptional regulator [Thermaerobacter sp.]